MIVKRESAVPTPQVNLFGVWGEHIEYVHSDEDPAEETRNSRNQQPLPKESDDTNTPHPERLPIKMFVRSKPLDPGLLRKVTEGRQIVRFNPTIPRTNAVKFGHLPCLYVGNNWSYRLGAAWDGTHPAPMAGVWFASECAVSIALSGGYEDDIDEGYRFIYSESGGRGKNNKARQSKAQPWNGSNAALRKNEGNKRPVRVICGFKGNHLWSPKEGFMYCGLYIAVAYWVEAGIVLHLSLFIVG